MFQVTIAVIAPSLLPVDAGQPAARRLGHPRGMWRKLAVLAGLVALGFALEALGLFDWPAALQWARAHAGGWALPAAIVLAQVVLFTLAQPGSILFWAAALLYSPAAATLILTAGGTAGALGACLLARRVTRIDLDKARGSRIFRLLERHSDAFTLCALRVLPGMPHSVLNYACGTLRVPLPRFLYASAAGLALKSYVYASAVDGVLGVAGPWDLVSLEVLGPLFVVTLLLLLYARLHERLHELPLEKQERHQQRGNRHDRAGADHRPVDARLGGAEDGEADREGPRVHRIGDDQRPEEVVPVVAHRDQAVGEVGGPGERHVHAPKHA
jgi:uncharacterized membrane protein YdjX (TVP38/TMEM64 family)